MTDERERASVLGSPRGASADGGEGAPRPSHATGARRGGGERASVLGSPRGEAPRMKIDINCDMGESFGPWRMGADVMCGITRSSANIACGAHAGDPVVMRR